jgi:hypothetical protein
MTFARVTNLEDRWNARRKPVALTNNDRRVGADRLRYEAHYAYLDGRSVRAKELHRKADLLDRETRKDA